QPGERIVVKGLVRPDMQITPLLAEIDGTPVDLSKTVGAAQ
ncbi:efflux transporter periplasmic adaptor subunit, partial [Pseudomonas aeruginosa]